MYDKCQAIIDIFILKNDWKCGTIQDIWNQQLYTDIYLLRETIKIFLLLYNNQINVLFQL